MVDHQQIQRAFFLLQFQPELFLEGGEEARNFALGRIGARRVSENSKELHVVLEEGVEPSWPVKAAGF